LPAGQTFDASNFHPLGVVENPGGRIRNHDVFGRERQVLTDAMGEDSRATRARLRRVRGDCRRERRGAYRGFNHRRRAMRLRKFMLSTTKPNHVQETLQIRSLAYGSGMSWASGGS
jgi:hypothetical protein